jgi:hypothetical protein
MRFPQVGERMRAAPAHALRAMFAGIGQVLLVADRMRSRPAGPDADQPGAGKPQVAAPRATAVECAPARPAAAEQPRPAVSAPADHEASRWRSLDQTGNVRILPVSYQASPPAEPIPVETSPPAEPPPAQSGPLAEPVPPEPETIPAASPEPVAEWAGSAESQLAWPGPTEPDPAEPAPAEPALTEPALTEPALSEPAPAASASADTAGPARLPVPNYDDLSLASLRARLRNLDSGQVGTLLDYEQAHAARPAVLVMFERRISKLETGQG